MNHADNAKRLAREAAYGLTAKAIEDKLAEHDAAVDAMALGEPVAWQPISTAPKDIPLWLFALELVDTDFCPAGVVDGHWQDDVGWMGATWDGYRDEWRTSTIHPTHWMMPWSPAQAAQDTPTQQVNKSVMDDLTTLVRRLVRELRKAAPENDLAANALGYLDRKGLKANILRDETEPNQTLPVEIHGKLYNVPIAVQVHIVALEMKVEAAPTQQIAATGEVLTDAEIDGLIARHVDPFATYRKLHNYAHAVEAAVLEKLK